MSIGSRSAPPLALTPPPVASGQARPARRRRWLFTLIAIISIAIALTGFWPTYFGRLLTTGVQVLPIVHLHAVVFSGWLALLLTQALLAANGRVALHMRVGRIGMAYGALLFVVGELTAFAVFGARVASGDVAAARAQLFAPVTDLLVFAPVLAAAWIYRQRPEIHKRLIVVATSVLLIAAVHRIALFGSPPPPLPILLLVWLAPILLGIAHDLVTRRSVHPVYLLGIAAIVFLKFLRRPLARSDGWRGFVDWLVTAYS